MNIEAKCINHYFGDERVLKCVDLKIEKGNFIALTGESGSGKTTLLSILSTLMKPTVGTVLLGGEETNKIKNIDEFRRRNVGFVFQFHYLIDYLTMAENVNLGAIKKGSSRHLMERLGVSKLSERYSNEVSGGERQRVAIARALVNNPSILFADEPTGNLDTKNALSVFQIFKELSSEGMTIVVASHDKKIQEYADVTIEMEDGCVKNIFKK